MKNVKRMMAFALTFLTVFALGISTLASQDAEPATGNTITVSGAQNGETYNIYKMLDLSVNNQVTPTAYRYTINNKWAGFWTTGAGKDYVDTNTSGTDTYVVWKVGKDTAADMETFAKEAVAYAKDNQIAADGDPVVAADETASWTALDNGYYLVTSTYGIAASVASTPTNPVQTISEKNSSNTTDKKVKEAVERNNSGDSWNIESDAAVGDTIQFRANVSIAKNSVNVKYHDTMTNGLSWTGITNTKVYTDEVLQTELDSTNYSVAAGTDGETFTVSFTDEYVALLEHPTQVWVGYTAVLNDNALVTENQTNIGKVTWGDNGTSAETTTTTKTHKFELLKYDGADAGKNPLANAKFQLFTVATEGTPLKLAKNAAGTEYRVVDMSDVGATLPEGFTLVSDDKIVTLASGNITISGVDSDEYYLEETDPPTGFNPLSERVRVEVNADNNLVAEVVNNQGSTLPSTGGIGTTIFYIVGAILVVIAGVLLVTRRRMKDE